MSFGVGEQAFGRRSSGGWSRATLRRRVVAGAAAVALLGLATGFQPALADTPVAAPNGSYIVQSATSDPGNSQATADVERVSGTVRANLDEGVLTSLNPAQLASLEQNPSVVVSSDDPVVLDPVAPSSTTTMTTTTRAATDVFHTVTNADPLVAAGTDGRGVTVAVLDTGIDSALPNFGTRVIGGVDLSGEGDPYHDSYGHGTFVAGLIAGNGGSPSALNGQGPSYNGEAPGANLVAIKVAGASGALSISTVIEGIDWAIANKDTLGIKVLNLSLGTSPMESTTISPLNRAVERAWKSGIVVVASAGNFGPTNGTITKPGDDPLVITAGATDDQGTVSSADDTVPAFSSVGPTWANGWFKPDVAVPGRSVVSVMAPGSTVAVNNPGGLVEPGYFRGSGTSFSAAVTSGAAALILQAHPSATPDEVKGRIIATATAGPVGDPFVDGHGVPDVGAAVAADDAVFNQAAALVSGQVGLDQANPTTITFPMSALPGFAGSQVDLGKTWVSSTWNPASWVGSTGTGPWTGSGWNGSGWNGSGWNGSGWNGSGWNGSGWNGASFNGSGWNGSGWNGSGWNGSGWNGSGWNGSGWNGSGWNGSGWNGSGWNGSGWNGSGWN